MRFTRAASSTALDVYDHEPLPANHPLRKRSQYRDDTASRLRRAGNIGKSFTGKSPKTHSPF